MFLEVDAGRARARRSEQVPSGRYRSVFARRTSLGFASAAAVGLLGLAAWSTAVPAAAQTYSENFDGVTAPALPSGWATSAAVGTDSWVTSTDSPDTAPNAVMLNSNSIFPADTRLDSQPVWITTTAAQLTFHHRHAFAVDPGSSPTCPCPVAFGTLEISIDGGAFQEIQAAGGSFVAGGYNDASGWVGQNTVPLSYTPVVVNLPAAAAGAAVVFRWRLAWGGSPNITGAGLWWVDTIQICDGYPCDAVPLPRGLSIADGGNGVWEPGEAVDVLPTYENNGGSLLDLAGTLAGLGGPGGAGNYVINDGSADYGEIPPAALGGCAGTGDCYNVEESSGIRMVPHWDAQLAELLDNGLPVTWALHIGGSFADTPATSAFYKAVETVFHRRVTNGCGGNDFCPGSPVLREQTAVLLLKSRFGANYVPPPAIGIFADVPASDPFAPWIESFYGLGITVGCAPSPLMYCPDQPVLRRQIAVFLLKTLLGSDYTPPVCGNIFSDVLCPSPFAAWIEDLFQRQITAGCGSGIFCPDNGSTRGQAAAFLVRTFGLSLYGP